MISTSLCAPMWCALNNETLVSTPIMSLTAFITWLSYCGLHLVFKLLCPKVTPASSLLSWCYTFCMFSPCPPSAGLQKLWSLIFRLSACSSLHLSPHPPQPLCLFSASIYFVSLPQEHSIPQSLYWPLSPYLSSRRSLQSRQCTFSVTVPPLSLSISLSFPLPLCSLDMDKFIPVFSLTKRPSVSDTDCLGNHHAPVTLSHLSMSRTNMHTQTHEHRQATQTHTNSRGRFKEHFSCACVLCVCLCQKLVCISTLLHAYVPPAVQISVVCGGWNSVHCPALLLFSTILLNS